MTGRASHFGDLRGRAIWVVIGALVCQMGLGLSYANGPLLTDVTADLGWTRAEFSLGSSFRIWMTALGSPVIGLLTVRYGGRTVLVCSVLTAGVVHWGLSRMDSLVEFALWSAINGLVMVGVGDLVAGQVVTEWVERGRGLALGLVYAGSNIGGWLVLNAAAAIATWASWREAYLYVGIAGVIVLLPFAGLAIRAPAPGEGAADAELDLDEGATEGLGAALRTRSFWLLAFGIAAFFAYFVGILDHLVPFLEGQGFSKQQAAWYYSVAVFLGFFSKPIFGLMADRIEARSALLLNTALFALSSLMLFGIPGPAFLWAFVLLYGISSTARDVVYPLIVVYCFGVRRMAAVYGAVMLGLLVGPLGSIGAAAIRDRTGSYHGAFFLFAALNVLSVVLLTAVRREIGREGRFLEEGLPEEG